MRVRRNGGNACRAYPQRPPRHRRPGRFNELHRLSVADPVAFGKLNLAADSGQLSRAHLDHLQGVQDAINRQDLKGIQASRLVNDTVGAMNADLRAAGVNTDHEPGTEDAHAHARLESGLRDQLIAAQQAKNGAPLTRTEASDILLGYLKDHALSGKGVFAGTDGDRAEPQRADGAAPTDKQPAQPQKAAPAEQTGNEAASDGIALRMDELHEQPQASQPQSDESGDGAPDGIALRSDELPGGTSGLAASGQKAVGGMAKRPDGKAAGKAVNPPAI